MVSLFNTRLIGGFFIGSLTAFVYGDKLTYVIEDLVQILIFDL